MRCRFGWLFFLSLLFILSSVATAGADNKEESDIHGEPTWGIGVTVRTGLIPFVTEEHTVSSFVPMMFYDGERFFLDGLEGGVKLFNGESFKVDLLGRLRFFDIPKIYQNDIQEDTLDLGLRLKYFITDGLETSLELMSDDYGRTHGNFRIRYHAQSGNFEFWPFLNFRRVDSDFNSYYYGLGLSDVDAGNEFSMGLSGRYHLWKNLYAIGEIQATRLSEEATELSYISQRNVAEAYLGIAFFNDPGKEKKQELSIRTYVRV